MSSSPGSVLAGVRVLDLTQVWAGPLTARYLADLGADVIKIESCRRLDLIRPLLVPSGDNGPRWFDHGGYYQTFNRNHRSLALDLNSEAGRQVFRRLVRGADVLVENFSPRVMANWGLGYEALRALNPRLIMVSLSGFGASGPYRDYVAYGNSIDPMTGLIYLTGYQGGPPVRSALSYPDPIAATHAAFACLCALMEREASGLGQHIDASMLEAAAFNVGEVLAEFDATGFCPQRMGNHHPLHAPHSLYPCAGEDEWVAVAVTDEEEWQGLCAVLGRPDLAADPQLQSAAGRKAREEELDALIAAWTSQHSKWEVMEALQGADVPAGAVLTNRELVENEHLRQRGFFVELTYDDGRTFLHPGFPFRLSRTPLTVRCRAPGLGEHNRQILREIGYAEEEIDALIAEGVIGDAPALPTQA